MKGSLRFAPFAGPRAAGQEKSEAPATDTELPSIDEFIDELPPIEDFLAEEGAFSGNHTQHSENAIPAMPMDMGIPPVSVDSAAEGWGEGEWQSYDWNSLASLGRGQAQRPSAEESWGDTEWPGDESPDTPTADEIAGALEGIARRIRSGELVIDNLHGTPPEAAMAAALAVILRMRG